MKKVFIFISLLYFLSSNAQYKKGIVFLEDSTEVKGLIKIKTFGGLNYKKNDSSKVKIFRDSQLIGYDIHENEFINKYRFKKVESKFKKKQRFGPARKIKTDLKQRMQLVRLGKLNLYRIFVSNAGSAMAMGLPTSEGYSYFIEKNKKTIRLGFKIKNKQLYLFEDCPILLKKIITKEFKRSDIIKIVDSYNQNCK